MKGIYKLIFTKILGWSEEVTIPEFKKYIICLAPHTSNMDFFIGQIYYRSTGRKCQFLMKKEWFFWPLGPIFRSMGGIPVYRSKKMRMTDQLAEYATKSDEFGLCITPEGTRSLNPDWKCGFYYIALKANLPILLYAPDYKEKKVYATKYIVPSGDIEKDMREIKTYFKDFKGKYPEKFTVGEL